MRNLSLVVRHGRHQAGLAVNSINRRIPLPIALCLFLGASLSPIPATPAQIDLQISRERRVSLHAKDLNGHLFILNNAKYGPASGVRVRLFSPANPNINDNIVSDNNGSFSLPGHNLDAIFLLISYGESKHLAVKVTIEPQAPELNIYLP